MNAPRTTILIIGTILLLASSALSSDVHDGRGRVGCLDCHRRLPFYSPVTFTEETSGVCQGCHQQSRHAHSVQAIPSMPIPPDMPLDKQGRITCYTCHTYHIGYTDAEGNKAYFLRRQRGKVLCFSCHKKL